MSADASRTIDPEATREAILDAATALFVDRGYEGVSMSAIAKDAGVTKSLIHHHFGTKADLYRDVKQRGMAEYFQMQRDLLENREPDATLLEDSIVIYFRFLQKRPDVVRLMSWMRLDTQDELMERGDDLIDLGVAQLERGQQAGLIRSDVDPTSLIVGFLGLVESYFQWTAAKCRHVEGLSDAQADDRYLDTILKMFRAAIVPR